MESIKNQIIIFPLIFFICRRLGIQSSNKFEENFPIIFHISIIDCKTLNIIITLEALKTKIVQFFLVQIFEILYLNIKFT
jgi:hypothetical protein